MMYCAQIQKLINRTNYWDAEVLKLDVRNFSSEIVVAIEDDEQENGMWEFHFLQCRKVIFQLADCCNGSSMHSTSNNHGDYWAQKIEVVDGTDQLYQVNLDFEFLQSEILCKDICIYRVAQDGNAVKWDLQIPIWGTGIFADAFAWDIRDAYLSLLSNGESVEAATCRLTDMYLPNEQDDKYSVFWLALAETQWVHGHLLRNVQQNAINMIEAGKDLQRNEFADPPRQNSRKQVLIATKKMLLSPQPHKEWINTSDPG